MEINYQKNILTPFQEEVLTKISQYQELQDFYLTGGTALAGFYLHHRYSDDLDFFTHSENFNTIKLDRVIKDLCHHQGYKIESVRRETLFYECFLSAKEKGPALKIDFVKDISIHFGKKQKWQEVWIDSLQNIASNKITAIFGRTEVKDFVDFYFLFKQNLSLESLFKEAQQKDGGLHEFYFAKQLRNIQAFEFLPRMIKPVSLEQLKAYFLEIADQFLDQVRPPS